MHAKEKFVGGAARRERRSCEENGEGDFQKSSKYGIGPLCGRLWVQISAGPTLRVFKITEEKVLPL